MLDKPPDFIIITLLDNTTQKFRSKDTVPEDFNLIQDENSNKIMIPVGCIARKELKVNKIPIQYEDHFLELGFVFTVWKVQGLTLDKVILALELLGKKSWNFEMIYVSFSRTKTVDGIRCLPLSKSFDKRKFLNLLPNINTTRWRMDTAKGNGQKWTKNPLSAKLRDKVKKKESSTLAKKEALPTNKSSQVKKQKMIEVKVEKTKVKKRSSEIKNHSKNETKDSPTKKKKIKNFFQKKTKSSKNISDEAIIKESPTKKTKIDNFFQKKVKSTKNIVYEMDLVEP